MNKNSVVIGITVVGLIIIITISVLLKIYYIDLDKKYDFVVENIINISKKCVIDEKCKDDVITLKDLYNNNYLEIQANPKTKKEFNDSSYIKVLNYEFVEIK